MNNTTPLLTGKIALVSGASRGIGRAIAMQLAQAGATVIGTATRQAGADHIRAYFEEHHLTGHGMLLNVTEVDSINAVADDIQTHIGTVDILVNNAGITRDNLMLRMKDEEWDDIINTNLSSNYHMVKAYLKPMIKKRWGRIINITSVVGISGNPGQANYAAAKAGVIGFTKSLAQEIGSRGVTANCVAPGFIDTDMTRELSDAHRDMLLNRIPLQRLGQAEDIAAAVNFLASPAASYITGETLHVNGGMLMV